MATTDRYGRSKKRRRSSSFFAPLTFLLICVAIVFGMGVFFRVQTIEVTGSISYSDEEIIDASGIDIGDNLFFINRSSASSRIFSRLPLVEEAVIERQLPKKIVISVEESNAMAYVDWEGQSWMMTGGCKLLGTGTWEDLAGLIHVMNVSPLSPTAGDTLELGPEESMKLSYMQTLLRAMQLAGLTGSVTRLDMQNPADPTFDYQGRFTVRMGPNDNTEYKLRMLLSAVAQMEPNVGGVIDLSEGTSVHVSPE